MTTTTINNGLRDVTVIASDAGKHFVRNSDGLDFGIDIWLGVNDSADNYTEVDLPEPEAPEEAEDEMDLA